MDFTMVVIFIGLFLSGGLVGLHFGYLSGRTFERAASEKELAQVLEAEGIE